ncbi:hypothetical protein V8E36_003772 [Tilletia maclaganii]
MASTTLTPAAAAAATPIADRPSLLTGINLYTAPSLNADKIAHELRARLEFASLKAANGLTLHSLDEIEQATNEAERLETLMQQQQQHHHHLASATATAPPHGDPSASSSPQRPVTAAQGQLSADVTPSTTPEKGRSYDETLWQSQSAFLGLDNKTSSPALQRQAAGSSQSSQPRTIFDAIAARAASASSTPQTASSLLFPRTPASSRCPSALTSADRTTSSTSTRRMPVMSKASAAALLQQAASIPQLGSPRRLVNIHGGSGITDPHNEPSQQTQIEERNMVVAFEQQQRKEAAAAAHARSQALLQQRQRSAQAASYGTKRSHNPTSRSARDAALQPPPAKRSRLSKESIAAAHARLPLWDCENTGLSPSKSLVTTMSSMRSPSSKLASSYARGIAVSSAIGTGLARSPDVRSVRPMGATANASSLAFQSPRGLTLGQNLGITSRNTVHASSSSVVPLSSRVREESFERGVSSMASGSAASPASSNLRTRQTESVTPVQRSRPLLSPPHSSPAIRSDKTSDDPLHKPVPSASPEPQFPLARGRQRGLAASPAQALRSPARLTSVARQRAVQPEMAAPPLRPSTPPAPALSVRSTTPTAVPAPAQNFGLGFDFENGDPADMPAPATPKSAGRLLQALKGDPSAEGCGETAPPDSQHLDGDENMDHSEAAQLMLFFAGSPSAPASTRFSTGVTPSVTNIPFAMSTDKSGEAGSGQMNGGAAGQNQGGRRPSMMAAADDRGNSALVGVGPGSGSPGPEGTMVARMLTYGLKRNDTHTIKKDQSDSSSPRSISTASTPLLGLPSADSFSTASSTSANTHPSEDAHGSERQLMSGHSRATTPESSTSPVMTATAVKVPSRDGAVTPPPHPTARPATPPRQAPCTPKAPGSSTFSYAEFLNVSPSPQPRLRRTPRIGVGKHMSRTGSGDRPGAAGDVTRTPSRTARGRFLDFDQELGGAHSATMEQRKRFAQMVQIGEEDDGDADPDAPVAEELVPGPLADGVEAQRSQRVRSARSGSPEPPRSSLPGGAKLMALKEKSHNHSPGMLDPTAIPHLMSARARSTAAANTTTTTNAAGAPRSPAASVTDPGFGIGMGIGLGLSASPVLKAQAVPRPMTLAPSTAILSPATPEVLTPGPRPTHD